MLEKSYVVAVLLYVTAVSSLEEPVGLQDI